MNAIYFNPPFEDNYIPHILKEIYVDKVYDKFLVGRKDLTIIDVGANIGLTSYFFSKFAKQAIAVEPAQEHFEILEKMVSYNKLHNVKPIKVAIGNKSGKLQLKHNENKTMFSLSEAIQSEESEEVEVLTIDQLFKQAKIVKADFVKLDVEGEEMNILGGEGFGRVADKIDTIMIEYHAWSGRNSGQLVQALERYDFKVRTVPTDASLFVGSR